jgi:hypothetical protein
MVSKSPSRSHGEGSIYRSDYTRSGSGVTVERWIASVDLGVGPNGKRLRKRITGPTRKAVADKLRALQRQQDAGVDVRKKSITVADLANEWLTHLEQNEGTKEEARSCACVRVSNGTSSRPGGSVDASSTSSPSLRSRRGYVREAESGGKEASRRRRRRAATTSRCWARCSSGHVARRYVTGIRRGSPSCRRTGRQRTRTPRRSTASRESNESFTRDSTRR